MRFRVYGLTLDSEISLEGLLPPAESESEPATRVAIKLRQPCKVEVAPKSWFMSWRLPTGKVWLRCAKDDQGFVLQFPKLADFFVNAAGQEIRCSPRPKTSSDTLRHLLLDQVLPLVLNFKGREVLHATANLTPQGVCAFVGPTGTGKSTLAASLVRSGYAALSDDCLVLANSGGRVMATPAYPGLRLWPDAVKALCNGGECLKPVAQYTSKQRLVRPPSSAEFPTEAQPVARIYSLAPRTDTARAGRRSKPLIERLSHRDGFIELLQFAFRLDITDREMLRRQFRFLEEVTARVPVRRLTVPDDFSSLPAVCEAILADLDSRP